MIAVANQCLILQIYQMFRSILYENHWNFSGLLQIFRTFAERLSQNQKAVA